MEWKRQIKEQAMSELSVHPHCPEERADLFTAYDGESAEIETCEFLYSLVRILKPNKVLETGTAKGIAAIAMASAMKENGFGKLFTIENKKDIAEIASARLDKAGLSKFVKVIVQDSIQFCEETRFKFKFAFLDSSIPIRTKEFTILNHKGSLDIVAFHDTSRHREKALKTPGEPQDEYLKQLRYLEQDCTGMIDFCFSRGLRLMQTTGFIGEQQ
ncbi:MAG: class I SAM-dependent methyltransferase [Patescibacteria group bacterium]